MLKRTLYKIDSTGSHRQWSVEVNEESDKSVIRFEAGKVGGALVPNERPITEGKNIGRSNETTHYQQACLEADSEYAAKIKKGYVDNIDDVKAKGTLGSGISAPMLAQKYDASLKQKGSKNLKKLKLEGVDVMTSDKLDGNRCLTHVTKDFAHQYTRSGMRFPDFPHIQEKLVEVFNKIYKYVNEKYGVTEYWLDGELFTQKYSFNTVNGLLKKKSELTPEKKAILADVGYHIYDVILPVGYETRYKIIQYFDVPGLNVVKCKTHAADEHTIQAELEDAMARGQEGLMIRQLGIPYENKRTWQLLKVKVFEDDEFEIIGFKQSSTGDTLGSIQFKMNGDMSHVTFYAGFNAPDEDQKAMWDTRDSYVGKKMTVEYFGFSPIEEGGRPRFPKAKAVREGND